MSWVSAHKLPFATFSCSKDFRPFRWGCGCGCGVLGAGAGALRILEWVVRRGHGNALLSLDMHD